MNDYFTAEDISWANYVSICTDRAGALIGHRKGFQAEIEQIGRHVNFIHCVIHRKSLRSGLLFSRIYLICSLDCFLLFKAQMQLFFSCLTVFQLFMKKLVLWKSLYERHTLGMFVSMIEYLEESDNTI
jgi:hypothetical protein